MEEANCILFTLPAGKNAWDRTTRSEIKGVHLVGANMTLYFNAMGQLIDVRDSQGETDALQSTTPRAGGEPQEVRRVSYDDETIALVTRAAQSFVEARNRQEVARDKLEGLTRFLK